MLKKFWVALAIVGLGVCFVLTGQVPGMEFETSTRWQYIMLLAAVGPGIFAIADILSAKTVHPLMMVGRLLDRVIGVFAVLWFVWFAFFVAQVANPLAPFAATFLGAFSLLALWQTLGNVRSEEPVLQKMIAT